MHPDQALVPSTATQLAWIERVLAEGIRRPGSAANARVAAWAEEQFRLIGLHDVRAEPLPVPVWDFRSATLTAWPESRPDEADTFVGFALPHTQSTGGFVAPLVRHVADETDPADVVGRIAVEQLTFTVIPQHLLAPAATAVHDPEDEFATLNHTLPFGPRMQAFAQPAIDAGAGGFVGVLSGVPWETCDYYVPYDGEYRDVPALWLSRSDGARLDALLDDALLDGSGQPVIGRLQVDANRTDGETHNVIGTLPGASDDWVIIGSHHDAPWASAVEDGTGIAMVLAQATYWASVPEHERPHNLMFLLTGGHMVHGAGTAAFIAKHPDLLERTVLELHLEHAALETVGDGNGGLTTTGQPEVRWWFTSRDPQLEESVLEALRHEDLRRSMVLRPDIFMEHPPTDGGFFHLAGVPLVDFLAAPMYLFDSADTIDKVDVDALEPLARAAIRIVADLDGRTAAGIRQAISASIAAISADAPEA